MDLTKRLGLPQDLLNQVTQVLEGKKIVHPNQKAISAAAPPEDEITAADFKALKSKKKHRVEGFDRNKKRYESPIFETFEDAENFYNKLRKSAPLTGLEIVEIEEAKKENDMKEKDDEEDDDKEEVDEAKDLNTANANAEREHDCAKHVVHEQWGKGETIPTMHAEPDSEGNIAWYDVMFEHGIEQQVPTSDLEIILSETHVHKKSKKMSEQASSEIHGKNEKKTKGSKNPQINFKPDTGTMSNEEVDLEEGRKSGVVGQLLNNPKAKEHFTKLTGKEASYYHITKNPDHAETALKHASKGSEGGEAEKPSSGGDEDTEASQHPINKLRGIMDRGQGKFMGHTLTKAHASKLVAQHDSLKPAQKVDFVQNIGTHVKKVVGG